MKRNTKQVEIQIGSANDVDRYDDKVNSTGWETIILSRGDAVENKYEDALMQLIDQMNSEEISNANDFIRVVVNGKEVINL